MWRFIDDIWKLEREGRKEKIEVERERRREVGREVECDIDFHWTYVKSTTAATPTRPKLHNMSRDHHWRGWKKGETRSGVWREVEAVVVVVVVVVETVGGSVSTPKIADANVAVATCHWCAAIFIGGPAVYSVCRPTDAHAWMSWRQLGAERACDENAQWPYWR